MSTLYIRLPSHSVAQGLQPGMPLYCPFAVASGTGALEREGVAALPDMAELVRRAHRVVLLLAASDVTLLRVKVPPLSQARLKAALPNLIEDQLMSDVEECVIVADNSRDEMRTVAVVQRDWLELLAKTLLQLGARGVSAVPEQLCLPHLPDAASAAVIEHGEDIDVAVRLSAYQGLGLSIVADQPEAAAFEVMQALGAVVPQGPLTLYVPQARLRDYQESLHLVPALDQRITLHSDEWKRWINGADKSAVDLMSGLGNFASAKIDWARWRWPMVLGVALLAVNIVALNIDWLRLKREAEALRTGMVQTYKSAFPKETVIIDPLAQLRQKVAGAQRDSGQFASDDFIALAATFGEAWSSSGQGQGSIGGLEYRDRSLIVKLKPDSKVDVEQIDKVLAAHNLSAKQTNAGTLQIRSGK